MRVAWLTAEYFLDTDEQMVPILQDRFEISWIIHGKKSTVGTSENVARVRTVEVVEPSYRARDPRLLMEFLGLVLKLRKLKPDVVYLGLVGLPHFHFLADLLLPKAKVICAVHNVDDYPGWGSRRWMRFYMRRMFKRFQHFHLFSKHTQESFLRQFPGKSTFQVPMALKSCGAGVRHRDDAKVRFLFFGGIRPNKNLALLIRAFRNLPADLRARAVLQVSGSCPASEVGAYQELVGSDPSIALDFRRIPDREIPDLFLSQHFLVLPYGHVAQSGPQMIAYNYRLPVLATDIPGFRERIEDGLDGYLFRPEDEMHLSEVMAEAIRTHQDRYPRLVENLERRIQKEWEPEIVSELYARMFMKVGQARQEGTLA